MCQQMANAQTIKKLGQASAKVSIFLKSSQRPNKAAQRWRIQRRSTSEMCPNLRRQDSDRACSGLCHTVRQNGLSVCQHYPTTDQHRNPKPTPINSIALATTSSCHSPTRITFLACIPVWVYACLLSSLPEPPWPVCYHSVPLTAFTVSVCVFVCTAGFVQPVQAAPAKPSSCAP